jgi:hypothetical protein
MRRSQHEVPRPIDGCAFFQGMTAPQHEYDVLPVRIDLVHDAIGELLPALTLV